MPLLEPAPAAPSDRTIVRRHRERARYDRAEVHTILDEALLVHVGFTTSRGPVVLPMAHVRIEDTLYLHGAPANAMLGNALRGGEICVTSTLLDGLVLARSAFHHSMNYRSVVIFATAKEVTDGDEVRLASRALVDHLVAGRSELVRAPSDAEVRRTRFVSIPIEESSVKVRRGGPVDDEGDLASAVWAGDLPLRLEAGAPNPAAGVTAPWPHSTG